MSTSSYLSMMTIPSSFADRIIHMRGKTGELWLNSIFDTIRICEERWNLKVSEPFELSFNYVVKTIDAKVVIKVGLPGGEYQAELNALRYYNGIGLCRLIDTIEERNVLLLESLDPGTSLTDLNEDMAIRAACFVIREMQSVSKKIEKSFPTISDWANALEGIPANSLPNSVAMDSDLIKRVQDYCRDLQATQKNVYLLHGDLHHGNILAHGKLWKAIDPKGIVGETEFELAPFLLNNVAHESMETVIEYRVFQFSRELNINPDRVYGWGLFRAMLAVWWNIEDNQSASDLDLALLQFFNKKSRAFM